MARGGTKFPLIVYRHMLNRWWPPMFALGIAVFGLAYTEYLQPLGKFLPWRWQVFAGVGLLAILVGIFFLILRGIAYVQPFPQHLRLVTPFMQVNI